MTTLKSIGLVALTALAAGAALFWSGNGPALSGSFMSQRGGEDRAPGNAHELCRRGPPNHPPLRRLRGGRRSGGRGAYYYANPGCRQVVNAYGQIVYSCP